MKRFKFLFRAYQSLKSLLDPAHEGDPYVRETEPSHFVEPKDQVFQSRMLGIKGILRGYKGV